MMIGKQIQSLLHSSLEFPPNPEADSKSESESFMASKRIAITFRITSSKVSSAPKDLSFFAAFNFESFLSTWK